METEVEPKKQKFWVAALKFVPLLVFAVLVIVFKLDLLIAAPFATFAAAVVYMITERCKFEKAFSFGLKAAREITLVFFILMFAYGVAAHGFARSLQFGVRIVGHQGVDIRRGGLCNHVALALVTDAPTVKDDQQRFFGIFVLVWVFLTRGEYTCATDKEDGKPKKQFFHDVLLF